MAHRPDRPPPFLPGSGVERGDGARRAWLAVGVLALGLFTWELWRLDGPIGLLIASPGWGALLARPLLDGAGDAWRGVRRLAWRGVEGRHYAHRGRRIDVVEDADGQRFLRLAHLRVVLQGLPSDEALARRFQGRMLRHGSPGRPYLRDDALIEYLAPAQTPDALRLRHWVEKDVAGPGRRRRGQ